MNKKVLFLAVLVGLSVHALPQDRPNIIFILADDFGYTSLNCYGADESLVRTPHIDKIAKQSAIAKKMVRELEKIRETNATR